MPKYPATTFDEFNDIEIHSAGGSIDIISVEIEHHCLIDTLSRELSTGELTQFINDLAEEGGVEEVLEGASGLSTILAGISDPGDKVGELQLYLGMRGHYDVAVTTSERIKRLVAAEKELKALKQQIADCFGAK